MLYKLQVQKIPLQNYLLTAIISGSEYLMGYTETDLSPLDVFSQEEELELVNAGFGRAGDYEGLNLEGKIASSTKRRNRFY